MNECVSVPLSDPEVSWEKKISKPSENITDQLEWLKGMRDEENRLRAIKTEFIQTHIPSSIVPVNKELLKEFMPSEKVFYQMFINEDIPLPRAITFFDGKWDKESIEKHHQLVKEIFPDTKIFPVTNIDGEKGFAYTGMTTRTLVGCLELSAKQKAIQEAIKEQSAKLVGKAETSKNEEVTGTSMPRNLPKGVHIGKKTPQNFIA